MFPLRTMTTTTIRRGGTLKLPRKIWDAWKGRDEVVLLFEDDRLVVQPRDAEWDRYEAKMQKGRTVISSRLVNEAVRAARTRA